MTSFLKNGIPRKENGKIDFTPKKHHGFTGFIVLCGFLLPPLAVAVRFGIGKDFFINVICTICGYIPGHGHNWFIQNVRNNDNRNRTPKWAKRYGLVDDRAIKRKEKKRGWVGRYNDQNPDRIMVDDTGKQFVYKNGHAFEDGDENVDGIRKAKMIQDGTLIERDQYYNETSRPATSSSRSESIQEDPYSLRRSRSNLSTSTGFEERPRSKSKSRLFGGVGKKAKKDRHERSENAMAGAGHVFDDEFDRELQQTSNSSRGVGGQGQTSFANSNDRARRSSFDDEGPEDADQSIAKQYTGRAPPTQFSSNSRNSFKSTNQKSNVRNNNGYDFQDDRQLPPPPVPKSKAARDVMDLDHEF